MDCIFCKIAHGELPATVVYENDDVIAFEDIHKVAPVHVLLVPKTHLRSIAELSPDDTRLLSSIQSAVRNIIKTTGIEDTGFRVITNTGETAGQSVFHLHFHVIGGRDLQVTLG